MVEKKIEVKKGKNWFKIILILIGVFVFIFIMRLFITPFISENLVTSELTKDKYLACNSDIDCEVMSCNNCVNQKGYSLYFPTALIFGEPMYRCGLPKKCTCINNICSQIIQK